MARREFDYTLLALGVLVLIVAFYLLYRLDGQDVSIESEASVFLAILTAIYVFFTYALMNETRKQRMQDAQPAFAVKIEIEGVRVRNVGNGPALETALSLSVTSDGQEVIHDEVQNQDIPVGESVLFAMGDFQSFGADLMRDEQEGDELILEGRYVDSYQQEQQVPRRSYDLTEYGERMQSQIMDQSEEHQIAKELSSISSSIERIRKDRTFERIRDGHSIVKDALDVADEESDE